MTDVIAPPPDGPARLILLTRGEAAAVLQVSTKTLDRRIRCAALRCCRIGRSVRITLDHLTAYIESSSG